MRACITDTNYGRLTLIMNKRHMQKWWASLLILVGLTLPMTGCLVVAAGAGAGAYAFVRGGLESHLNAPMVDCIEAVKETMLQMGYVRVSESSDALTSRFIYRDSSDRKIEIKLDAKPRDLIAIRIRTGLIGDREHSLLILNTIHTNL